MEESEIRDSSSIRDRIEFVKRQSLFLAVPAKFNPPTMESRIPNEISCEFYKISVTKLLDDIGYAHKLETSRLLAEVEGLKQSLRHVISLGMPA